MGTGLLCFDGGDIAGGVGVVSGISVDFFAASALAGGVSAGCAGGGWRRSAIGLREAQPKELTQSAPRTQRAQSGKSDGLEEYLREPNCCIEIRARELMPKNNGPGEFFKGPPVS